MFLTVTLNSALDRVIYIEAFQPEAYMRSTRMVTSVGGKGLDASVALRTLGAETVGLSFVAGATGQELARVLESYGITPDLIWVEGETRIAHVIVETDYHRHSHVLTGQLDVSPDAWQRLLDRYQSNLPEADWVIAGGSLPASVPVSAYKTLSEMALSRDKPILIDSRGQPILEAIKARPTVLKMNRAEYIETFGVAAETVTELKPHVERLAKSQGLTNIVITSGGGGILAHTLEGTFLATAPRQRQVNAAGAGDAVSAALSWRLSQGDSWPDALRWAAATGAAVVLTEGTADCHMADIQRILPETDVRTL